MRALLVAKLGLRTETTQEIREDLPGRGEIVDTLDLYVGTDPKNTFVLRASKSYPVEFKDDKGFQHYQKFELRRMVMRELERHIFGE